MSDCEATICWNGATFAASDRDGNLLAEGIDLAGVWNLALKTMQRSDTCPTCGSQDPRFELHLENGPVIQPLYSCPDKWHA